MFDEFDEFLAKLDAEGIHYKLDRVRPEHVMVEVAVPGQRWEVEFAKDGRVEVEVFRSNGEILGREALEQLFSDHSG